MTTSAATHPGHSRTGEPAGNGVLHLRFAAARITVVDDFEASINRETERKFREWEDRQRAATRSQQ